MASNGKTCHPDRTYALVARLHLRRAVIDSSLLAAQKRVIIAFIMDRP